MYLFGGYDITPHKKLPKPDPPIHNYNITDDMKINEFPTVTVFQRKKRLLDGDYLLQCFAYSHWMKKRKTESIQFAFSSLSLDILDNDKYKDITEENRFLIDLVFSEPKVRKYQVTFELELYNYLVIFPLSFIAS